MQKILYYTGLIAILFIPAKLYASDYTIPEIRVEVKISEKGLVHIYEHRTYRFEGSFSWADYRLPLDGFGEIKNIRVSEGEQAFINENSGEQGTFSVSEGRNSIEIKWHYSAVDESRTFTVSYELTGAVSHGPEWSEFFWNYLASGRDKAVTNFEVELTFPQSITQDSLHAWSRGIESAAIRKYPGTILASAENISRRQSLQVRTLFPTDILDRDYVTSINPELNLETVLQQEEEYQRKIAAQAERDAFYSSITREVTLLIILLSVAIFIIIYRRYGSRFRTKTISGRETVVIPDRDTPPAIIGRLLNHSVTTGAHVTASLFDLSRRGWFMIREEKRENDKTDLKPSFIIDRSDKEPEDFNRLPEWERMLIRFVEKRINEGEYFFNKLFSDNSNKTYTWYSEWRKKIKEHYTALNWIDHKSYKGVFINLFLQALLVAASIVMLWLGSLFAVAGIIVTGIMMGLSATIVRRSKEGEEVFSRWAAYRNGLRNADKRTLRMEISDLHLIYATAFSIPEKQISTIIESSDKTSTNLFPWILFVPGSTHTPATVAAVVSALSASGTTSFSGSVGGGGASVGVAGGGASGGAG